MLKILLKSKIFIRLVAAVVLVGKISDFLTD